MHQVGDKIFIQGPRIDLEWTEVSSDFPALKEIVEGYQLGKTFDPEDPEDIASAMNYVLSDEKGHDEMRRNALEAAKIFNWENESKKLLGLYQRLVIRSDG